MAQKDADRTLLRPEEVAEILRLSRRTVIRMARDGEIPCIRIGRLVRFERADVERWLRQQRN